MKLAHVSSIVSSFQSGVSDARLRNRADGATLTLNYLRRMVIYLFLYRWPAPCASACVPGSSLHNSAFSLRIPPLPRSDCRFRDFHSTVADARASLWKLASRSRLQDSAPWIGDAGQILRLRGVKLALPRIDGNVIDRYCSCAAAWTCFWCHRDASSASDRQPMTWFQPSF